jgi:hypothetical protein
MRGQDVGTAAKTVSPEQVAHSGADDLSRQRQPERVAKEFVIDQGISAHRVPTSEREPAGSRWIKTPETRLRRTSKQAKNGGDGGI